MLIQQGGLKKRENERERAKFKRENEREREKSRFKSRCAKTQGEQGGLNSERGREKKRKRALMDPGSKKESLNGAFSKKLCEDEIIERDRDEIIERDHQR